MTYGWAILIVIVVIAALYGMGVFTLEAGVPCSPCFSYFAFVDYSAGTLLVRNGPQEINITAVSGGSIPATTNYEAAKDITITGISTTGDVDVTITYDMVGGLAGHTDSATIHN